MRLIVREVEMELKEAFKSSAGQVRRRSFLILEVEEDGLKGYSEAPLLDLPPYNHETLEEALEALGKFSSLLSGRSWPYALEVGKELAKIEPASFFPLTRSALEGVFWDLEARRRGLPLALLLAKASNSFAAEAIPAGVSLGIPPDLPTLLRQVEEYLEQGYRRIKLKIYPGRDLKPLQAVRQNFSEIPLAADANGSYTLKDFEHLKKLDELGLLLLEDPLRPDKLEAHAFLQKEIATPISLDEGMTSAREVLQALDLGSCRIINVKIGRVGGFLEALRIYKICQKYGVDMYCGGLLESGIGRAHSLALASLQGFTLPGDLSASDRYWAEDLVEPPVSLSTDGNIPLPKGTGLGLNVRQELLEELTKRKTVIELS